MKSQAVMEVFFGDNENVDSKLYGADSNRDTEIKHVRYLFLLSLVQHHKPTVIILKIAKVLSLCLVCAWIISVINMQFLSLSTTAAKNLLILKNREIVIITKVTVQ